MVKKESEMTAQKLNEVGLNDGIYRYGGTKKLSDEEILDKLLWHCLTRIKELTELGATQAQFTPKVDITDDPNMLNKLASILKEKGYEVLFGNANIMKVNLG